MKDSESKKVIIDELTKQGVDYVIDDEYSKHPSITFLNQRIYFSGTRTDYRGVRNARATVRRLIKKGRE